MVGAMPTYSRTLVGMEGSEERHEGGGGEEALATNSFAASLKSELAASDVLACDADPRVAAMRAVDAERLAAHREAEAARAARLDAAAHLLVTHSHGLPMFGIDQVGAAPPSQPSFLLPDSAHTLR